MSRKALFCCTKTFWMEKDSFNPQWLGKFFNNLFAYRYAICLLVVIGIIGLWFFLYFARDWTAKDAAQVCTGFFIVLTLFFTALNYEFAASKMKQDYRAAKETLTFNTANEWHKAPLKDFQKTSIEFENKFIASGDERSIEDFEKYIEGNLEFRESLKGILNYFENMSVGVHKKLIDKEFVYEFHSFIFEIYYTDYYYYIESHRVKRNNSTIWLNFTNLAEEWWPNLKAEILTGTKRSSIITKT